MSSSLASSFTALASCGWMFVGGSFYTRACKCQLFTDEGSRRLPKRLNYCFSVLASATNRSISKRMACGRSPPHYTFVHIIIVLNTQKKCEQYWNEQLDKPYDAGRGFTVVTTGYRGFADYVVRDMTLKRVSLSENMQL